MMFLKDLITASSHTDRFVALIGNGSVWVMASISSNTVEHGPAWITALGGLFLAICTGFYFLAKARAVTRGNSREEKNDP